FRSHSAAFNIPVVLPHLICSVAICAHVETNSKANCSRPISSTRSRRDPSRPPLASVEFPKDAQIFAIPRGHNTLARRIRTRSICARGNALLAQLAHVPILAIGHVPKFDGVVRVKVGAAESMGMKEPIAKDNHTFRRLR